MDEFSHIAEEILSHHECWNGTGYPRGLSGCYFKILQASEILWHTVNMMAPKKMRVI